MLPFWKNWFDTWGFALETQQVMAMRLSRLAAGGLPAVAEAERMVVEKFATLGLAHNAAALALFSGRGVGVAANHAMVPFRRRVRANRRRLSRG
jgi:hypothetical protein